VIGDQFGGTRSYNADYAAVWDVRTGKILRTMRGANKNGPLVAWLMEAKFDISGKKLLLASDAAEHNGVWSLSTGKKIAPILSCFSCLLSPDSYQNFFVCPDGEHLILIGYSGLPYQNMRTGKQVWSRELTE